MYTRGEKLVLGFVITYLVVALFWYATGGTPDEIEIQQPVLQQATQATGTATTPLPITNTQAQPVIASASKPIEQGSKLVIPKLAINTNIQSVGLTSKGNMGIPDNYTDVGWFNRGAKPGEVGNAVMAGHLDTYWWTPGVFRNLHQLTAGDDIYVNENGKTLHFRVTDKKIYDEHSTNLSEIFGKTDKRKLNLITCNGTWNSTVKRYNERLVVFSELVE